jgi:hypothetical protein
LMSLHMAFSLCVKFGVLVFSSETELIDRSIYLSIHLFIYLSIIYLWSLVVTQTPRLVEISLKMPMCHSRGVRKSWLQKLLLRYDIWLSFLDYWPKWVIWLLLT